MLKEILQVIELAGNKFKREKFVRLAFVHMLHFSGLSLAW